MGAVIKLFRLPIWPTSAKFEGAAIILDLRQLLSAGNCQAIDFRVVAEAEV
jgi:hypothetical protein